MNLRGSDMQNPKFKGEVIMFDVEEHGMFASVAAFKDGTLIWPVAHDARSGN